MDRDSPFIRGSDVCHVPLVVRTLRRRSLDGPQLDHAASRSDNPRNARSVLATDGSILKFCGCAMAWSSLV
ncbi:protein of unknown function [Agreia sp. COWG]|nr:protein of unknown function [Agreia sp. COWG]